MDVLASRELLDYAVAHPYDGTQAIKQYQQQVGDVTVTLFVDTAAQGHLSLTVKQPQAITDFQSILTQLALPNYRFVKRTKRKGYFIYRYQFDLPAQDKQEKPIEIVMSGSPAQNSKQPGWLTLADDQCHICHRQLEDPLSIRVRIGIKCRKNIEKAEGQTSAMWDNITQEELKAIWTAYNIHDKRRRERVKNSPSPKPDTSGFASRPLADYQPPSGGFTRPSIKRTPEPEPAPLLEAEEAECIFCGQKTTDYWSFDGKTKTCKCRPCYRQGKS